MDAMSLKCTRIDSWTTKCRTGDGFYHLS